MSVCPEGEATSWPGPHSKMSSVAARVAGPTSTDPGLAADWSAAAVPTTSPTAAVAHLVAARPAQLPLGPVSTPMRTESHARTTERAST